VMADWFNQGWRYWVQCPGEPLHRFITWAGAQRRVEDYLWRRIICASGSRKELEAGHVNVTDANQSRFDSTQSAQNDSRS
jgi:hypothetical protein